MSIIDVHVNYNLQSLIRQISREMTVQFTNGGEIPGDIQKSTGTIQNLNEK